ncbi:hypothetical protein ACFV7Q_34300 [Streptomyces sp. NPDC059851]|uniref:hypothetical protein n=1 Tax=Streptomyces sp. NPDC059851 TaxID=3346971 RepID=UPI00365909DE
MSSAKADEETARWLAAGPDPGASIHASCVPFTKNASALDAYTAQYHQVDGVSLGVGTVAIAAAFAVYWLLPVWRTRRSKPTPLDAVDVHGGLRPLIDELVPIAGLTRPPGDVPPSAWTAVWSPRATRSATGSALWCCTSSSHKIAALPDPPPPL